MSATIRQFDKANLAALRPIIVKAINDALAAQGVTASMGNTSFGPSTFTTKLTFTLAGEAKAEADADRVRVFRALHAAAGLRADDLDNAIRLNGTLYTIHGLRAGARASAPRVVIRRVKDGKEFLADVATVKYAQDEAAAYPVGYPKPMRSHTFDPTHLYSHRAQGYVYCGSHVGTEATYTPQQWDDLGPVKTVKLGDVTLSCESCSAGA